MARGGELHRCRRPWSRTVRLVSEFLPLGKLKSSPSPFCPSLDFTPGLPLLGIIEAPRTKRVFVTAG